MQLRNYQREALDALYTYWENNGGNPLITIPTGGGKSLLLAAACQELIKKYPTIRIGLISHVRELLTQNYQELLKLWPQASVGLFSSGLNKRDTHTQILIAGIQSVWGKTNIVGSFDILLIDECHLISKNAATMYGRFIAAQKQNTSDMRIVGMTATAFRLDSGRLDRGKGRLFDKIIYDANVIDLIEEGYLSPLVSKATVTQFDISGVQKRGGEYIPGQLEIAVDKEWVTRSAAQEIVKFGRDRKSWLAFCSGVKHASHMRDALRAEGITCEAVTGETPKAERDSFIRQFKAGKIRCLCSVGILGTGFNHPGTDLVALLRPTASPGLYCQQVGRALRKAPGKTNALILDFASNVARHGPIDTITVSSIGNAKDREPGEALTKTCPHCASILALATHLCPDCGYQFPIRDELPKHEAVADANTNILSQGKPQWVDVDRVAYYVHNKPGSPNSLRAEYSCGFTTHREWICLQHSGMARSKAEQWWLKTGQRPIPSTVSEALARVKELKTPEQICVRPNGKYFEIVGVRLERTMEAAE